MNNQEKKLKPKTQKELVQELKKIWTVDSKNPHYLRFQKYQLKQAFPELYEAIENLVFK